jgi:hypothetical protein
MTSLLPLLEPVLGIGFALNLAYIGLERFRYRDKIREHAKPLLDSLIGVHQGTRKTDLYKDLVRLSGLPNDEKDGTPGKSGLKRGRWAWFYRNWFECNWDREAAILSAFAIGILLFFGVGHQIGSLEWSNSTFKAGEGWWPPHITHWYYLSGFLAGLPVLNVCFGRWVVRAGIDEADYLYSETKNSLQQGAQTAASPVSGPTQPATAQPN